MMTKYVLPLLALVGIALGVFSVLPLSLVYSASPLELSIKKRTTEVSQPLQAPPQQPSGLEKTIAGAGLIEARMENIPIGTPVPGVVLEVYVDGRTGFNPPHKKVGARVKQGEPLFRIDDRDLRAELKTRESALDAALAQLHRLEQMPRPEDIPPTEAAIEEASARLQDAEAALNRDTHLFNRKMLAASDFDKDRFAVQAARATLAKAKADLAKLKAGAWKEDIDVQRSAVDQARSQVESMKILLERLIVRAPVDGQVLQVNVRPGQFAAETWKEPMVVLGDVNRLHVRVDIDENDLPRFREGVRAWATVKGRKEPRFNLEFVRIEPYVIPKKSLTGDNSERVDTRVLQVLYLLPDETSIKLYVGQQMDVFLAAGNNDKYLAGDVTVPENPPVSGGNPATSQPLLAAQRE
jgi:multidrug resistance efflux pump